MPEICLSHFPIVICLVAGATPAMAAPPTLQQAIGNPEDLKVSGSLRVRYEVLDGQPRAGLRAEDEQLTMRTTVAAEYRSGGLRVGGELYDSRAYLDRAGSAIGANEVNTFELVQAYVGADLGAALGRGSSLQLQAGRMTLNLGSRRLVAADDYRNTTNGYTGVRADARTRDGTTLTVIYTLPQVRLPADLPSVLRARTQWDRESFDLQLWGALMARPKTIAGATAEIGYFGLHEDDAPGRPTRNRSLHTMSARVIRDPKPGRWDFEAEGMYQFGGIRADLSSAASRLDVSAWFAHADAGYTFPGRLRARISLEYDYASGDGPGRGYGRFDTLFGMRRADLAPAGIYNAIGRANISTPGVRIEVAPGKRFDAFATYHALWLASRTDAFSTTGVRDASGQNGRFAGHQVDARLRYWIVPGFLRAEANAVWLRKGRFLRDAPNAPRSGDTHYLATGMIATF